MKHGYPAAMLTLVCALGGCTESAIITSCEAGNGMSPDCRFHNPEDMALLLNNTELIVSQFGAMDGSTPGSLVGYRLDTGDISVLFPTPQNAWVNSWGEQDCAPPDETLFSPHGIDFEELPGGEQMLLVVNHGGRESIEFFEVTGEPTSLAWRGCVLGPDGAYFNDVVAQHTGGFWVTHMMPKDGQGWAMLKSMLGLPSGFVYAWDPLDGFAEVAGSSGALPNGIEKSADERYLYVNMYMNDEVRKIDLVSGDVVAVAQVSGPDNVTWSNDGRLLVASHNASFSDMTACQDLSSGSCGFSFEIVAIDPVKMSTTTIVANEGAPMGGATVAVQVEDGLYLGTFAGDRITRVSLH